MILLLIGAAILWVVWALFTGAILWEDTVEFLEYPSIETGIHVLIGLGFTFLFLGATTVFIQWLYQLPH